MRIWAELLLLNEYCKDLTLAAKMLTRLSPVRMTVRLICNSSCDVRRRTTVKFVWLFFSSIVWIYITILTGNYEHEGKKEDMLCKQQTEIIM